MTLKYLLNSISVAAINQKCINYSAAGSDLYQLNTLRVDEYPILFTTPNGDHIVEENTTTFSLSLFYFDRLTSDNINDIDIYSAAIEQLKNFVMVIEHLDGVLKVNDGYRITNFSDTESFDDRVCGAYAEIQVVTDNKWKCPIE